MDKKDREKFEMKVQGFDRNDDKNLSAAGMGGGLSSLLPGMNSV